MEASGTIIVITIPCCSSNAAKVITSLFRGNMCGVCESVVCVVEEGVCLCDLYECVEGCRCGLYMCGESVRWCGSMFVCQVCSCEVCAGGVCE